MISSFFFFQLQQDFSRAGGPGVTTTTNRSAVYRAPSYTRSCGRRCEESGFSLRFRLVYVRLPLSIRLETSAIANVIFLHTDGSDGQKMVLLVLRLRGRALAWPQFAVKPPVRVSRIILRQLASASGLSRGQIDGW